MLKNVVGYSSRVLVRPLSSAALGRQCDLGKHLYQLFAVKSLVHQYPHLTAAQIHVAVQGLTTKLLLKDHAFKQLGNFSMQNDETSVQSLLSNLDDQFHRDVDVKSLAMYAHAKGLFQHLAKGYRVTTEKKDGIFESIISADDNEEVCRVEFCGDKDTCEKLACLRALENRFTSLIEQVDVSKLPLEKNVDLHGEAFHLCTVSVKKSSEEEFGFTLRGGEPRVVKNAEYVQQQIVTPVFVGKITEGSPAERSGIREGDTMIAVNDHLLRGVAHKQVVETICKFSDRESVQFTLKYEPKQLTQHAIEAKLVQREKDILRQEVSSEHLGQWHKARSEQKPEEYFVEKPKHKKKPYSTKKYLSASKRLWDKFR